MRENTGAAVKQAKLKDFCASITLQFSTAIAGLQYKIIYDIIENALI
jgi:hypothetical protein